MEGTQIHINNNNNKNDFILFFFLGQGHEQI